MKLSSRLAAAAVILLPALCHVAAAPACTTKYPTPTAPLGGGGPFATASGRLFEIQSKVQYFAGTNSWWMSQLQNDTDIFNVFAEMALTQLKVTRVWAFSETNDAATRSNQVYFQVLNSTGQHFNFDPTTGIPRLDAVVSAAEAKGVKLVLPLLNNYGDLGGIPAYNAAFKSTPTSFYTDAASQTAYKAYINLIVNRYKKSPAIFAWELCNEPRCHGCDTSVITKWATDVSKYIKTLDTKHLVALGDEGWFANDAGIGDGSYAYGGLEGVDFVKNLKIPSLDYGTFHAYPDQWGYNNSWVNTWIMQHDAVGKAAKKPVIFEEYGSTLATGKQSVVGPWQETVRGKTSVAADMFWQFGTQGLSGGFRPFDDYAVYYDQAKGSDYEVLGFEHAAMMLAKEPVAKL